MPYLLLPPSITHLPIACCAPLLFRLSPRRSPFFALFCYTAVRRLAVSSHCCLLHCRLPPAAVCHPAVNLSAVCRLASSALCNAPATNRCSPPLCHEFNPSTRCVEQRLPLSTREPRPDVSAVAPDPRPGPSLQGGSGAHVPLIGVTKAYQTGGRRVRGTTPGASRPRFFSPAQAHVAESARFASAATIIPLQSATTQGSGMDRQPLPEGTNRDGWLQKAAFRCASTGRSQRDASPQGISSGMYARAAEAPTMGLRDVLEQRGREPLTPYDRKAWEEQLSNLGLLERYPCLISGLTEGFDLGVPPIHCTYTPPNHPSISPLHNVFKNIIDNEFTAGQYVGPFLCTQLELALGPFQTSPMSLVLKTSKPGKYRVVHNFSFAHKPTTNATSVNSNIDSDDFPCTWGTFATAALIIAHLPPGSQASVCDVAEAYRTIPTRPCHPSPSGRPIRSQPMQQLWPLIGRGHVWDVGRCRGGHIPWTGDGPVGEMGRQSHLLQNTMGASGAL